MDTATEVLHKKILDAVGMKSGRMRTAILEITYPVADTYKIEVRFDFDERITGCTLRHGWGPDDYIGYAVCNSVDAYSQVTGRNVALAKAGWPELRRAVGIGLLLGEADVDGYHVKVTYRTYEGEA